MCAHVGNQRSRGIVIARLQSSVRSLLHQRRDLHPPTYLYLSEDREPTTHQTPKATRVKCDEAKLSGRCTLR
jgi:hypothetical protein